tara:strand:- start:580 stop:1008 length:429 start_codon:yes stop_codon:yes gene_type:complete
MKKNNIYKADNSMSRPIELHLTAVEAGFPSPADDHLDIALDLNEYLIKHPAATFYIYVKGDSMINDGIYSGDIMIVDRSLAPKTKDIVIAIVNGEFTVKRIYKKNNKIYLSPSNKNYKSIPITNDMDFQIWGVVTHTIHHCR